MRRYWWVGVILIVAVAAGVYFWPKRWLNPNGSEKQIPELNLMKYDFDSLRQRGGVASEIVIGGTIPAVEVRRKAAKLVYKNKFVTREISFESDGKKVSGMMNYYDDGVKRPVVIMIRGYADTAGYYPGYGTWRVADKLADEGYTTVSSDFLGYADSDAASTDVMEARFHKVVEVLDLIASVKQLPWVDKNHIGIWAHSNGGQIALSVLEVTGVKYPTALWAPMTDPFPQSLIDTADPGDDTQKTTDFVNVFLQHYDGRRYAFQNYYAWIQAPILIQQGTADDQVKVEWQQTVISSLKSLGKKAELTIYQGDDHNMSRDWEKVVVEDKGFYGNNLGK